MKGEEDDASFDKSIDSLASVNEKAGSQSQTLFENIKAEMSVYIFTKSNKFRVACYKISNSWTFEHIILMLIFMSTLKLVSDTYFID